MKVDISPNLPPSSSWTAAAPTGSGSDGGGSSVCSRSTRRIMGVLLDRTAFSVVLAGSREPVNTGPTAGPTRSMRLRRRPGGDASRCRSARRRSLALGGLQDAGAVLVRALVGAHLLDAALVAVGEHGADLVRPSSS